MPVVKKSNKISSQGFLLLRNRFKNFYHDDLRAKYYFGLPKFPDVD